MCYVLLVFQSVQDGVVKEVKTEEGGDRSEVYRGREGLEIICPIICG